MEIQNERNENEEQILIPDKEIEIENDITIPQEDEVVEFKIITTDELCNPEGEAAFCTSEDGVTTQYKFSCINPNDRIEIQTTEGPTQYIVFSSFEEAEQAGHLTATMDVLAMNNLLKVEVPSPLAFDHELEIESGLNLNGMITVIPNESTADYITIEGSSFESVESTNIISKDLRSFSWSSVDEIIEEVVRLSSEYSDNNRADEDDPLQISCREKQPKWERDPMSLPFSYAGQSFNVQSQKLILNVMHFFKTHKRDDFIDSIKTPQEKAARVLNVSSSVIGKIQKNWKNGKLVQPGKTRKMLKRVLDRVSSADEAVIRNIINGSCDSSVVPTIPLILTAARERINYVGSRTSFRRILNRMGYKFRKIDKKMVLVDPGGTTVKVRNQSSQVTAHPETQTHYQASSISNTSSHRQTTVAVPLVSTELFTVPILSSLDPHIQLEISQLQKIQLIAQNPQIYGQQQFTVPIQSYSHNLPISVATPHQIQNRTTSTFQHPNQSQ